MRIDKFLSDAAPYSRKEIHELIHAGAVSVNGAIVKKNDFKVSETDAVQVHGQEVLYRRYIYLMMNKPAGYLSATEDDKDPVVLNLLPEKYLHFKPFPVGRLDKDTEGLLLLTNNGHFDHILTSPVKNCYKRYFAVLDEPAVEEDIAVFQRGMELYDFTAKPAVLEITEDPHQVFVEIAEGKFHQVKRMFEKVGKKVIYLKRVKIGGLSLDDTLPSGEIRELTKDDFRCIPLQVEEFPDVF